MPICFLQRVVSLIAKCLVAVLGRLCLKLVLSVCVEPLLRFEHALYESCLVLHVVSFYLVASLFWSVCDVVFLAFASMPCLTCFDHIF